MRPGHSLAYQFHPAILDDLGLTAALESLTDDFTRREGIEIDVAQSVREQIAPEVAYCFYYVAQGPCGTSRGMHERGGSC